MKHWDDNMGIENILVEMRQMLFELFPSLKNKDSMMEARFLGTLLINRAENQRQLYFKANRMMFTDHINRTIYEAIGQLLVSFDDVCLSALYLYMKQNGSLISAAYLAALTDVALDNWEDEDYPELFDAEKFIAERSSIQ